MRFQFQIFFVTLCWYFWYSAAVFVPKVWTLRLKFLRFMLTPVKAFTSISLSCFGSRTQDKWRCGSCLIIAVSHLFLTHISVPVAGRLIPIGGALGWLLCRSLESLRSDEFRARLSASRHWQRRSPLSFFSLCGFWRWSKIV